MYRYQNKSDFLLNTIVFSLLGCFSYLFISDYAQISQNAHGLLASLGVLAAVILIFNIIGHILISVNEKIAPSFLNKKRNLALYLLAIGLLLFILDYLIFVCIKWMAGMPEPFILKAPGMRMKLIAWILQLIMVGQIIINNFYRKLVGLYRKTAELEDNAAQAKYQALQNQLNPHFLFNNLNALVSEIEYNPKNAALFTRHLSEVYRYILQSSDQRVKTLQSELDFLDSYLFLHHVRLGNCIQVNNHINPLFLEMKMPPLTLQLLVENVIKHNVISLSKPMTIDIAISEKDMMLTVSNNIRIKTVLIPSGKGLRNLFERYLLLCGRGIEVINDNQYFMVKVPLLNE